MAGCTGGSVCTTTIRLKQNLSGPSNHAFLAKCWFRFAVARSGAVAPKAAMRLAQVARTTCSMACVAPIRNTRRRHIDGIMRSGLCMKLRKPSEHTSAPGFDRKTLWQQVHFRSLLSTCTYP